MDDEERILLDPSLSIDREYCLRHEGVWSEGTDTEPISLKNVQHKINGLKDQINRVCTKDDDGLRRWRLHTQNTHPLSMAPKLLRDQYNCPGTSQAYCKFLEILRRYRLVNPRLGQLHSIHLCEAPGHFVSSLDRFLCTFYPKKEWFWQANSYIRHCGNDSIVSGAVAPRVFPGFYAIDAYCRFSKVQVKFVPIIFAVRYHSRLYQLFPPILGAVTDVSTRGEMERERERKKEGDKGYHPSF
ncbi:hypothetical protein Y032_0309g2064 [Ancylostoma ceylanicum]|uniref:Cap-specific mRNA (nucleoside-2'-O-)-methyltransferase 2 n=1 Tax=Ancylostoma ceylanicum TaxID=53326 RepID=A0A016S390_9BILA|nr:hypothetical protein Y032_0309g2064 [Ancylostoma ceylanicum]